ncbi:hypothetical protein PROFUN_00743 [Planoprotostelium fungivorum]|uniref:Tetratricopeptide repeat protein n=1 Tax=Planoprotostelium fungivorum TaxID=1890364 RepID=A0A2P6NU90_9EUKA|nr:hypothetical protein PROFUN_00743 [Planoprotostelium fungivorum]
MTSKVYAHFEGTPDFTWIVDLNKNPLRTVGQIKETFVQIYNQRKKKIEDSRSIESLRQGEDIFFVHVSQPTRAETRAETKVQVEEKSATKATSVSQEKEERGSSQPELSAQEAQKLVALLKESLSEAEEHAKNGKLREAVKIYKRVLTYVPTEMNSLHHLGEIYSFAGRKKEAIQFYRDGAKHHPHMFEFHHSLGKAYHENGQYQEAIQSFEKAIRIAKEKQPNLVPVVQLGMGKSMYKTTTHRSAGASIVQKLFQENENDAEVLLEFAQILADQNRKRDALRVCLKIITLKQDETGRQLLGEIVREEKEGLKWILDEIQPDGKNAVAMVFLASILKNEGAIAEAGELYRIATDADPKNVGFRLSYVHNLEVLNEQKKVFTSTADFCKKNPKLSAGGLTCHHISSLIEGIEDVSNHVHCREVETGELSSEQLDLFALFFTLVKVIYNAGSLEVLPPLLSLLEKAKGNRELHKTTIRNEHAYYLSINDVMKHQKLPIRDDLKPLYVAGDSHSMSSAWQTVNVRGEERILWPLLATGVKCWHLRKESHFYPKYNFHNVLRTAPDGSEVIFLFGEIDCREGLLLAVEKLKYENLREAMDETIDIYLSVLSQLKEKRHLKVYVHPIAPVLNETRETVKAFNERLKGKVQKSQLKYLDFFEEMLTEDGKELKETLQMDGTHLSPLYVPIMEAAINRI